jgi:leucyl-tRNA synthetase
MVIMMTKVAMTKSFNDQYQLDVIGTSHCRSRTIACTKIEYEHFEQWRVAKGNLSFNAPNLD